MTGTYSIETKAIPQRDREKRPPEACGRVCGMLYYPEITTQRIISSSESFLIAKSFK